MFLYCWIKILPILKLELRTMPVLKYGITSPIVSSVIFGHLGAFCTKCALSDHLLKVRIWMHCFKRSKGANIKKYQRDTPRNYNRQFQCAWNQSIEGQKLLNLLKYSKNTNLLDLQKSYWRLKNQIIVKTYFER
jgi:hypothetical protein